VSFAGATPDGPRPVDSAERLLREREVQRRAHQQRQVRNVANRTRIRQMMPRLVISAAVMILVLLLEFVLLPGMVFPGNRLATPAKRPVAQLDEALRTVREIEEQGEVRRAQAQALEEKRQELVGRVSKLDQEELGIIAERIAEPAPRASDPVLWVEVVKNLLIGVLFFLLGMWVQQKRRGGIRV
jgi:hypothetical protein